MVASIKDLDRYETEATVYYFIWFTIYIVLGVGAIALPAFGRYGFQFWNIQ